MAIPTAPGTRVLVVEDNTDLLESLLLLLSLKGFAARGAADGPEALLLALDWRPDVVISDIGLPGMDGWQLARRVRNALGSSVRLIAVTALGQQSDRDRSSAAGFDFHLTKPADPQALLDLLSDGSPGRACPSRLVG